MHILKLSQSYRLRSGTQAQQFVLTSSSGHYNICSSLRSTGLKIYFCKGLPPAICLVLFPLSSFSKLKQFCVVLLMSYDTLGCKSQQTLVKLAKTIEKLIGSCNWKTSIKVDSMVDLTCQPWLEFPGILLILPSAEG